MAARCVVAFWLLLLCLCAAHVSSFYLFCPPCDPATCEDPPCSQSSGLRYYDECLCCVKCYRALGQRCGGLSSYRCRPGLNCKHRLGLIFGEERTGICEEGMRADLWCCVFSLKLKSACSILGCFMNTCCCFVGVLSIIHHSNCLHCLRRGLALCTPHHDLHLGAMMLECMGVVCRCA